MVQPLRHAKHEYPPSHTFFYPFCLIPTNQKVIPTLPPITRYTQQEAFSKPADQELVAYYTSCEGANTFSDQLVTAYLQGSAAQGLLDALDDDEFATECPDEVCRWLVLVVAISSTFFFCFALLGGYTAFALSFAFFSLLSGCCCSCT